MSYETVIGLEIHVQLATRSKAFCGDDASFGGAPNTHTSAVSLAHPGTLPRLNKKAIEYAVRLGLALGCDIARHSTFDRKNYFYADLPKGFQTTQQNNPICLGGQLTVDGGRRTARLHHIHLEEDAGKSLHDQTPHESLIDLNRAGVPLLEIVTEPDLRSAEEVAAFMSEIRRLVRWLGISDGNMEEGSLRCDVNVSVRKSGEKKLGQRCEIKNVNSMRFARRAIEFEVKRQIGILESGGKVEQETRGFDAATGTTYSLREKEEAHDYRYFPEPDLPPVVISAALLEKIQSEMPPLPQVMEQTFQTKYGLSTHDAALFTQEREIADYFLQLTTHNNPQPVIPPRQIANLIINKLLPWSASTGTPLNACPVPPTAWLEFLNLIENQQVSASTAYQRLFPALLEEPEHSPTLLATEMNLLQNADADFLEKIADEVLARFPEKAAEYRKGKKGLIGFFMGELMKASKGKAEPKTATRLLEEKLK
ncbi:MAG: Asp-tRNA(Asn)/Glu-tRNA(Gln) amidotransferase subunit GatB [Saprospiraceae bacterium]|nr:Asp-tRNA(Asn)/Glu-tRNA(Gln) amidotransferase subunit GatB [Saprospiraceae bacterium]